MKRNTEKTGLRSRRGVTIVECTVALVVIAIISAAAVSMILLSVQVEANFVTVTNAQRNGENVLECFRFSDDTETFSQALQKTDDYIYHPEENAYVFEGKSMTVTVKASFSPRKLEYTAVKPNGEEIYSYTFPGEGGGQ